MHVYNVFENKIYEAITIPLNDENSGSLSNKHTREILNEIQWSDVIHSLRFSIDGATKEVFEKIRVYGKFDRLIKNLNTFKKLNNGKIKNLQINSIVSNDTKNQLAYQN